MNISVRDDLSSLIASRLNKYKSSTDIQIINAAKEIIQEIALCGLSRQGFFKHAAFHGGSAFRILYGLDRFSEDLDFCLFHPNPQFELKTLLNPLANELEAWGLPVELIDRSKASLAAQKAFLKNNSLGAQLLLKRPIHQEQKFTIKIELDINPPSGAVIENKLCDFPFDFYVTSHNLSSMFAGKMHAILCRQYIKGRDWYDLGIYLTRKIPINLELLSSALQQTGPHSSSLTTKTVDTSWVLRELRIKIKAIDFAQVINDVRPFIIDESKVSLWNQSFFLEKVEKYEESLFNKTE